MRKDESSHAELITAWLAITEVMKVQIIYHEINSKITKRDKQIIKTVYLQHNK